MGRVRYIPSDLQYRTAQVLFRSKNKNLKLGIGSHKHQPDDLNTAGKHTKSMSEFGVLRLLVRAAYYLMTMHAFHALWKPYCTYNSCGDRARHHALIE